MTIKLSKLEWLIFLGFGLFLCSTPYLFTRDWSGLKFDDIGGTIGGVTAPFLSFFGSILVYLALKAQIDANRLVQAQIIKQENEDHLRTKILYYENKISTLKGEINEFYFSFIDSSYPGSYQKFNYQGSQAIYKLLSEHKNTFVGISNREFYDVQPKFLELKHLLVFFLETIRSIENENFTIDIKNNFYYSLRYYFYSKIKGNFKSMEKYKSNHTIKCPEGCGNIHGLPEELFNIVDEIEIVLATN